MPNNDMTPQQRAVKVFEMLLERPRRASEMATEVGVQRQNIYDTLNALSARDGIPIANAGGYWFLVPGYELASVFKVYQRVRASASNVDGDATVHLEITAREARLVMAFLERHLPPIP